MKKLILIIFLVLPFLFFAKDEVYAQACSGFVKCSAYDEGTRDCSVDQSWVNTIADSPNCPNFQGSCSITCRPGGGGGGGTCRCGLNNQGGCASCAGPTCNLSVVDCPPGMARGAS